MFEVHDKLRFADYVQLPGLHVTALKLALESAKAYQHHELHGRPDCDKYRMGRAGHTAVLENNRFFSDYVQWETEHEDGTKRIRRGKAWDDFVSANAGKTILTPEQYTRACNIRDAVRDHPIAGPIVRRVGQRELSLRWKHKRTGADCKSRLDLATSQEIVDIKLTANPRELPFATISAKLNYPMQGAFYQDGAEACGLGLLPFTIIAVQDEAPHEVYVYEVGDDIIGYGRDDYERAIDVVLECRRKQQWPGAAEDHARPLLMPAWWLAQRAAELSSEPIDFGTEEVIQ